MNDIWTGIFDEACALGLAIDDARRLTNLVLCAALTSPGAEDEMKVRVKRLMRAPGPKFDLRPLEWFTLAKTTRQIAGMSPSSVDLDQWVRAFQQADPNRKCLGAYATPRGFADGLAVMVDLKSLGSQASIVDPACGAGALLVACLDDVQPEPGLARRQAALRLHGMELDPAARELACLLIWIAAGAHEEDLEPISRNVRCGNALVHDWLDEEPFDALVMNPPWESLRHRADDPVQAVERAATLSRINQASPGSPGLPPLFSAQGTGDRNLCKAFIELAPHLIATGGRIAALIPAAFTSDEGMAGLRRLYLDFFDLDSWTGFENRGKAFDIDSRYKFGIVAGSRSATGTRKMALRAFATKPEELHGPHVVVGRQQLDLIGGPVSMIPDITSSTELDILTRMLSGGTPFFDEGELGRVRYKREVDLTIGKQKSMFRPVDGRSVRWNDDATMHVGRDGLFVPVLEGRMVGQYDFFQKSWVEGHGRKAVWRDNGDDPLSHCRPQYVARPSDNLHHRVAICDVTSATNTRTVHASLVPEGWICGNTAPVLRFQSEDAMMAGLAVLNSMTFDWLARRMVSGLHLNKFYLSCLSWPALGSEEVESLATAARKLAAIAPRRPLGLARLKNDVEVEVQTAIEAIVAKGYHLSQRDLRFMLSADPADRRGFWRYYASVPAASIVSKQAAELLVA